jgi:hypothetical protein
MMGGGQWGGRYQMRKGTHLPKFISPRNPFAREDASIVSCSQPRAVADDELGRTTSFKPTPERKVEPGQPNLALLIAGRVARGLWSACKKLKGAKRPVIPVFGKATIQPELSLESVKVVRNDLAEADLEVVARGGARTPLPGPQTVLLAAGNPSAAPK